MSAWEAVDRTQCPCCRYRRRCPARKVLAADPSDASALSLMRGGTCSQYEWAGRKGKGASR